MTSPLRAALLSLAGAALAVAALDAVPAPPDAAAARILRAAELADVGLADFQAAALPAFPIANDRNIRFGSIGSDIFVQPDDDGNSFWAVTDRGPNGQPGGRRTFPVPDFDPTILHYRVQGDRIVLTDAIPIVKEDGSPVTGLSNIQGYDEVPWNYDATTQLSPYRPSGLDTEGIVRLSDGTFWLCDEYSPSLVHVAADGTVLKRLIPEDLALSGTGYPVSDTLPKILTKRRQNRGFEGLALTPDGETMFVVLQSPLEHPTRAIGRASRNTRILRVDVASETVTGEFVYRIDEICSFLGKAPGCGDNPGDMKLSSLVALSGTKLLVDERTDDVAKVYLVDISTATDIYLSQYDQIVTSAADPNLEGLADPSTAGVTVLPKTLIVDLSTLPGMPKKIEGIALVNPVTLAVANDNDFGLVDETTFDQDGNLSNDTGAKSKILYIKLAQPLP